MWEWSPHAERTKSEIRNQKLRAYLFFEILLQYSDFTMALFSCGHRDRQSEQAGKERGEEEVGRGMEGREGGKYEEQRG